MTRIIKTVSLDEKSAQLAKQMPNFSHFVRECLFRYASNFQAQECARDSLEEFEGKCNPFIAPTCFVCWPDGCPPKKSVRQFRQDSLSVSWLLEQAKYANRELPDLTNVNYSKQESARLPSESRGKRTLLEKLLPEYLRLRRERKALENPRQPKEQE